MNEIALSMYTMGNHLSMLSDSLYVGLITQ